MKCRCSCTFDDEFDEWKLAVIKLLFNNELKPIGFEKDMIGDDGLLIKIQFQLTGQKKGVNYD